MDPMTLAWDPSPGLILLLYLLAWAARQRLSRDFGALLWPLPGDRPD
jgi:hypothetical protein